jgi:hypothetical protein
VVDDPTDALAEGDWLRSAARCLCPSPGGLFSLSDPGLMKRTEVRQFGVAGK